MSCWHAVYGLKQVPRAWFEYFCAAMLQQTEFVKNSQDFSLCSLRSMWQKASTTLRGWHNHHGRWHLRDSVRKTSSLATISGEEFRPLRYFLSFEILLSPQDIISQKKYISDILKRANNSDCKTVDTPLQQNVKLRPTNDETHIDHTRCKYLVGELVYFHITRWDISHAVGIVSQFVPHVDYYATILRVMRYLWGTFTCSLMFPATSRLGYRSDHKEILLLHLSWRPVDPLKE